MVLVETQPFGPGEGGGAGGAGALQVRGADGLHRAQRLQHFRGRHLEEGGQRKRLTQAHHGQRMVGWMPAGRWTGAPGAGGLRAGCAAARGAARELEEV